jgi:hypothetical protein
MLFAVLISGCATIVGDKTQLMPVSSTPSDAFISIIDEKGTEVFKGTTPTTVTLPKSDGSYWGKKSYTVKINKEGYEPQIIPITASANGWYIGGNLIFGGLIGYFIVDPLNGAMYKLSPEQITTTLGEKVLPKTEGDVSFLMLQDVPDSLRQDMTRIN